MKQNDYTYNMVRDCERNIIGVMVRYKSENAIIIPLIDIILQTEKLFDKENIK